MPDKDVSGQPTSASSAIHLRWASSEPVLGMALDPPFGIQRTIVDGVEIDAPRRYIPHSVRLAIWNVLENTIKMSWQPSGTAWNWEGRTLVTAALNPDRRSVTLRRLGDGAWSESWRLPRPPAEHGGYSTVPPMVLPGPGGKQFILNVPDGVYRLERGKKDARRLSDAALREDDLLLSSTGKLLAIHRKIGGNSIAEGSRSTISIYDLGTGNSRLLDDWSVDAAALTQDRLPLTWSRDSKWLLVREDRDLDLGPGKVWAFNVQTGAKTLIWSCDAPVESIAWHEGSPPSP